MAKIKTIPVKTKRIPKGKISVKSKSAKGKIKAHPKAEAVETTIEIVRNNRPGKNNSVRDIGPAAESMPESFTINKLTPEVMPKTESVLTEDGGAVNFQVEHLDDTPSYELHRQGPAKRAMLQQDEEAAIEAATDKILAEVMPKDTVRVKFVKFVNLVSSRDFREVITANADEEIIMSSNLLTELAGSQDRVEERKIPLVFLVGIAIGVVLTYIFFST